MKENPAYKRLKFLYIVVLLLTIASFIAGVLYTARNKIQSDSIPLEQWSIVATLAGIYIFLRLFGRPKQGVVSTNYTLKYCIKLAGLITIYLFDLINFTNSGSKNFIFLAFITIFAIILCKPNTNRVQITTNQEEQ